MPEKGVELTPNEKLLTLDERKRIISIFANLGVNKLRFTGGEPTISKDLIPLIEHAQSIPGGVIKSIALTSNGIILNQQLHSLKQAGLTSVNISLDTFMEKKFGEISRREGKLLNRVLSSIFTAKSLDIPVKVNCVIIRGMNDDEMGNFVTFAKEHNVTVRFIELMPFDGNRWDSTQFVSYFEMIERIEKESVNADFFIVYVTSRESHISAFRISNW
jgi:cyclic pyranopterin phosphate synthase